MKILISNDEKNIGVIKDYSDMGPGLIGQTIVELEIIKQELLYIYENEEIGE